MQAIQREQPAQKITTRVEKSMGFPACAASHPVVASEKKKRKRLWDNTFFVTRFMAELQLGADY